MRHGGRRVTGGRAASDGEWWAVSSILDVQGAVLALSVAAGTAGAAGAESLTSEMALTLRDAVAQALEGNPGLVDTRLDRMLQRYDAKEAGEHFRPQWRLGTSAATWGYAQAEHERDVRVSVGPGVEMRLPTGGRIEAGPRWERAIGGADAGVESARLVVSVTQPLARGAGWDVASAPVAEAALTEAENVLGVRGVVMDVVTEVVTAYRAVMRTALQTEIERRSLAQAVESRKVVEALIATGRIARSDLTQSDADVAEREIGVVQSEAANDEAQAALAVLLGLEAGVKVRTTEPLEVLPSPADERASLDRALGSHIGYRRAEVAVRRAELARDLAEDSARWEVSLDAQASFAGGGIGDLADRLDSHGDYRVALSLAIPFGDSRARAEERSRLAARIGYIKATRGLATSRRELEIEVREAVERVRTQARRMRLAGEALALARKTARIEEGRLRRGLTSSYRMGQIRTDLATAATSELNARIDYLNALSALDRVEGTVLDRWGITVVDDTAEATMDDPRRQGGTGEGAAAPAARTAARAGTEPEEAGRGGRVRSARTVAGGAVDTGLMLRLDEAPATPGAAGLRLVTGAGVVSLR